MALTGILCCLEHVVILRNSEQHAMNKQHKYYIHIICIYYIYIILGYLPPECWINLPPWIYRSEGGENPETPWRLAKVNRTCTFSQMNVSKLMTSGRPGWKWKGNMMLSCCCVFESRKVYMSIIYTCLHKEVLLSCIRVWDFEDEDHWRGIQWY